MIPIDSPWIPPHFIEAQLKTLKEYENNQSEQILAILIQSNDDEKKNQIEPLFSLIHRRALKHLESFLVTNTGKSTQQFLLNLPHIKTKWHHNFYFK